MSKIKKVKIDEIYVKSNSKPSSTFASQTINLTKPIEIASVDLDNYVKDGDAVIQNLYNGDNLSGINITYNGNKPIDFGNILVNFAESQKGQSGEKYWNYVKGSGFVDGNETPWCACFVSWLMGNIKYNGESLSSKLGHEGPGVYGFVVSAYENGILRYNDSCPKYAGHNEETYTPKVGDLIIFDWDKSWTLNPYEDVDEYMNDHIGIVKEVQGGRIISIEGNADGVVKERSYDMSGEEITAFIDWQEIEM